MQAIKAFAVAVLFVGCSTEPVVEDDRIDEPELTIEECTVLPDTVADEHEHEALVDGVLEDDAASFDDDFVVPPFDVDVVDNQPQLPREQHPLQVALVQRRGALGGEGEVRAEQQRYDERR